VEGRLARIEQAHPDPDPYLRAFPHGTRTEYHLARGDPDQAIAHNQLCAEACLETNRHHPLFSALPVQRGRAYLTAGDTAGVAAVLESASGRVSHPVVDDVHLPALRAWVAFQAGELRVARRITDEVLETAAQLGAPAHDVGTILATVVIAAIELEAGNFASAEELLRTAEGAAQLNGQSGLRSLVSLGLARLATATCDQPAAFAHLTEARFVFDAPSPTVLASFAAEELRQALAFSPRHGQRLVSQLPNRTDARLLRVRLAIAQEDQKAAAELLDTIDARTTRERIEQATLRALTMADHNADAAHAHLREALLVARPQGFYRTILEQGFAVSGLLQSFPPR
jgi:tetratricopeptide (TPR) repeat protein